MSDIENANKLFDLVNPIQWDEYKESDQNYFHRNGRLYQQPPTRIKVQELRQKAKNLGIRKYYSLKRDELIKQLALMNDTK